MVSLNGFYASLCLMKVSTLHGFTTQPSSRSTKFVFGPSHTNPTLLQDSKSPQIELEEEGSCLSSLLIEKPTTTTNIPPPSTPCGVIDRRHWMTSMLLASASSSLLSACSAAATDLPWQTTPVNKRTGVTVFDAERAGYKVNFVTYLSRFLLTFDANCQRWWYERVRASL